MSDLRILPLTPSIARYTFSFFWFSEIYYLHEFRGSFAVGFCTVPFSIRVVSRFYREFKLNVQTKNQIMFYLYGLTVGSFLWNIGDITGTDDEYNYSLTLTAIHIQAFCYMSLIGTDVRLGMNPSKMIINPWHMLLITFFFCISAQWIYPFATWYNWILHFYTFLLAIESSITTTTQEFVYGEFPRDPSLLPDRKPREPWKEWKYL